MSKTLSCPEARGQDSPSSISQSLAMGRARLPRHFQVKLLPSAEDNPLVEGVGVSHEQPVPAAAGR